MKKIISVFAVCLMAACGADGAPGSPTAKLGLGIGPNGIRPNLRLGTVGGNASVGVGTGGANLAVREGPVNVGVPL